MTVERGFGVISETIIPRLAIPFWLYKLPIKQFSNQIIFNPGQFYLFILQSRIRRIDQAWKLLAVFMHKSIQFRGEQIADDPKLINESRDIFTRLVAANDEKAKYYLDESEVVSKRVVILDRQVMCFSFVGREYLHIDVCWTWYGHKRSVPLLLRDLRMAETTALVLTATIAYLALYQDEQEKTYQEITSAVPSDRDPVCLPPKIFSRKSHNPLHCRI